MSNVDQIIKGHKGYTKEIEVYPVTVGESLEDEYKRIYSRVWRYNLYHIIDTVGMKDDRGVMNESAAWLW